MWIFGEERFMTVQKNSEKKRTKVICFANNKGGSGKSTTCANVGYSLSLLGKKVLLIDGDMQMNLSLSFFDEDQVLSFAKGEKNLYVAVKGQKDLTDYIIPTGFEGVDMICSSTLMSSMEYELFTKWQREMILRKCLSGVRQSDVYDYILIDAPPTLGGWVMNIFCASDVVIIPVEASPWGLFGLGNLFEFMEAVGQMNEELRVGGIVLTKVDMRKSYFRQTMEALEDMEPLTVFKTPVRVDSSIEWSQDNHRPVGAFRPSCRSAKEYMELTKEICRAIKTM